MSILEDYIAGTKNYDNHPFINKPGKTILFVMPRLLMPDYYMMISVGMALNVDHN